MAVTLNTPITKIIGIGPRRAHAFKQLGIMTVYDLLHHYPIGYTFAPKPGDKGWCPGETITIRGKVATNLALTGPRSSCTVQTEAGPTIDITWFNARYVSNLIDKGAWIIASGKVSEHGLVNPVFKVAPRRELLPPARSLNTITYPVTAGITSKSIHKIVIQVLTGLPPGQPDWLADIHHPATQGQADRAIRLAKREELFYMQLGLALQQYQREQGEPNICCVPPVLDIRTHLPFNPTQGQDSAMNDVLRDMRSGRGMNRLLQGDVGCGKTAVAAYAAMLVAVNGGQTAILCPTQILAKQHYASIRGYFERAGLRCRLHLGGVADTPESYKNRPGDAEVTVGTTSLLSSRTAPQFDRLGLVVIDEQHKFGVEQRAAIQRHGNPHCLMMTATPIPRTIAMTAFGDLDVSTIKDMPPGRLPVETYRIGPNVIGSRPVCDPIIDRELKQSRQIYVVCPRIEALDDEMRAVEEVANEYRSRFPQASIGVLHGKMAKDAKALAMQWWNNPAAYGRILVSTTVVEVGVDNPNATIMVVESAERFGLATLHQLRGRVGRGKHQSYCFLVSDTESGDGRKRLRTMERTNDGFAIAEEDLKIRGPGDFLSTRQHGLPELRIADLVDDYEMMLQARSDAQELVKEDPTLAAHPRHQNELSRRWPDNYSKKG